MVYRAQAFLKLEFHQTEARRKIKSDSGIFFLFAIQKLNSITYKGVRRTGFKS